MVDQYPDTLTYEGGTVKCRFVPNVRNATIRRSTDGTEVNYAFDIALPLDSPHFKTGMIVTGTDSSGTYLVYEAELIEFHPGQLHNRAWV